MNKTINVMPEFKSVILCCENVSVSRIFVSASKTFIERAFKLATAQKIKSINAN